MRTRTYGGVRGKETKQKKYRFLTYSIAYNTLVHTAYFLLLIYPDEFAYVVAAACGFGEKDVFGIVAERSSSGKYP